MKINKRKCSGGRTTKVAEFPAHGVAVAASSVRDDAEIDKMVVSGIAGAEIFSLDISGKELQYLLQFIATSRSGRAAMASALVFAATGEQP